MKALHAKETIAGWRAMAAADKDGFVRALITAHYDPLYARARKRFEGDAARVLSLADLSEAALARAAEDILQMNWPVATDCHV
jgi:tRNA 2-selenouridine synthase